MRIKALLKTVRQAGVDVKGVGGWAKRGPALFVAVRGIMLHHTGSNPAGGNFPALGTVVDGRPDLPGPLCHLLEGRNGAFKVIANGKANHAGVGGPWLIGRVKENLGNAFLIGIEIENNGVGESYPSEQMDALVEVCAALLLRYRRRLARRSPAKAAKRVIGHKEWTSRKIDPSFDMDQFRKRVKKRLVELKA